jgi:hypothetical protein
MDRTYEEGLAEGIELERERIALALKKLDDKWAMIALEDLLDKKDSVRQDLPTMTDGEKG